MRILETDCEIEYDGRGATSLGRGHRVILIKDDGSVIIHGPTGVKPLNYMRNVADASEETASDGARVLSVTGQGGEILSVVMHRIVMDMTLETPFDGERPRRSGTERQLQEWASRSENWASILPGSSFIRREARTSNGSIDLVGRLDDGGVLLVEVKRIGHRNDVFQVLRYADAVTTAMRSDEAASTQIEALNGSGPVTVTAADCARISCVIVCTSARPGLDEACSAHGVRLVVVGDDWMGETIPADKAARTSGIGGRHLAGGAVPLVH